MRNAYTIMIVKPSGKRLFGRQAKSRWEHGSSRNRV
jgi:hypothetical protein